MTNYWGRGYCGGLKLPEKSRAIQFLIKQITRDVKEPLNVFDDKETMSLGKGRE